MAIRIWGGMHLQDHARACKELRESQTFATLLKVTLTLGNYLNHGNKRLGDASGFRLKALNKTADTRSVDGKSTLMQVRVGDVL
jgi:hypothetical protein